MGGFQHAVTGKSKKVIENFPLLAFLANFDYYFGFE